MSAFRISKDDVLLLLPRATAYPAEVGQRLQWFLHFAEHGSIWGTCRHFGIARTTFYRWARRFDPLHLASLADLPTVLPGKTAGDSVSPQPNGEAATAFLALSRSAAAHSGGGEGQPAGGHPPASPQGLGRTHAGTGAGCLVCQVRRWNWRPVRRTLIVASVLANVAIACALLTTAYIETQGAALAARVTDSHARAHASDARFENPRP